MRLAGLFIAATALALAAMSCSSSDDRKNDDDDDPAAGGCGAPDQDGVIGGGFTFELDISDTDFSPSRILKAQNSGNVTLTVKNTGTKPHDFVVQCLTTNGCTGCFPDAAKVPALQPGESKTVTFTAPALEGIYTFSSDVPGDTMTGQFILQ